MAVAIMGGLVVATSSRLLFLPALYAAWFRVPRTNRRYRTATRSRLRVFIYLGSMERRDFVKLCAAAGAGAIARGAAPRPQRAPLQARHAGRRQGARRPHRAAQGRQQLRLRLSVLVHARASSCGWTSPRRRHRPEDRVRPAYRWEAASAKARRWWPTPPSAPTR
jgi:hypothetical protein